MHMIHKITVIVQQYGLSKILSILNRVDTVPRDLYYNVDASAIAQHTVCNISGMIEFDLR
jgi:hypothetical protein